jgi:hypothetical protein
VTGNFRERSQPTPAKSVSRGGTLASISSSTSTSRPALLRCFRYAYTAQHSTAQHSTAQHSTAQHSMFLKAGRHSSAVARPPTLTCTWTAHHSNTQRNTAEHDCAGRLASMSNIAPRSCLLAASRGPAQHGTKRCTALQRTIVKESSINQQTKRLPA